MGGAVEMCSGVGACRKTLEGTMCPSYMATRDEEHSTRGRANVLRLAMAGRLGEAGLGDEGVYEALDLCLECRACKSRVPGRRGRGALQERVPGRLLAAARHAAAGARASATRERLARWGSRLAPLSNWSLGSAPGGALNETAARASTGGASCRRGRAGRCRDELQRADGAPSAATPCSSWTRSPTTTTRRSAWRRSTCCARRHRRRASRRNGCCGRPQISKGLLDDARAAGRARTPTPLYDAAAAGRPSSSASRAACRPCARMRRRCCAARRASRRRVVARRQRAVRGVPRAELAPGGACRSRAGPAHRPAARPLPPEVDGPAAPAAGAAVADSRRDGRRSRRRLLRHGRLVRLRPGALRRVAGHRRTQALPRRARAGAPDAVVVAAGTSCRHQVARLHRRRRPCTRPCCCGRSLRRAPRMSLAVALPRRPGRRDDRQLLSRS